MKDCTSRNNAGKGIRIAAELVDTPTRVTFEGEVSSHNNNDGIDLSIGVGGGAVYYANVIVKGVLNTHSNTKNGLDALNANSQFTVKECGLYISCDNALQDIYNGNGGLINFVEEGTNGYAYDSAVTGGSGSGLPPTRVACDEVSNISSCDLNGSESPSSEPSESPSIEPSSEPSESPSAKPSDALTATPSSTPSDMPSSMPSTNDPTPAPSAHSSKSSKGRSRTSKSSKTKSSKTTAGTAIKADFMTSGGQSLCPLVIDNIALTLIMASGSLVWFMF